MQKSWEWDQKGVLSAIYWKKQLNWNRLFNSWSKVEKTIIQKTEKALKMEIKFFQKWLSNEQKISLGMLDASVSRRQVGNAAPNGEDGHKDIQCLEPISINCHPSPNVLTWI